MDRMTKIIPKISRGLPVNNSEPGPPRLGEAGFDLFLILIYMVKKTIKIPSR